MEGMVGDGFSFGGKWGSCSWVVLGRVTDHKSHLGLGWLAAADHSGVAVIQADTTSHYGHCWQGVCLALGGGRGPPWSQCHSILGPSARLPISIWL